MHVHKTEDLKKTETGSLQPEGHVTVVGAGLTGASWAALFLIHGRRVRIYDRNPKIQETAIDRIHDHVALLRPPASDSGHRTDADLDGLLFCNELVDAVEDSVFVQECVHESYEAKREVFRLVDRFASPQTVIATSSSGLSVSRIQTAARRPERCLAGHPYNPPHLIPLVEVAPGDKTSPEAVAAARRFYESVGKRPVVLSRDIPGYLANRMSAALWREAVNLVLDGVASVEDVDHAIAWGPGLRWAVMGPHLIYHLGGGEGGIRYHMDHLADTKETILSDLKEWKKFPPHTAEALAEGLPTLDETESLSVERDRKILRIIRALEEK